MPVPRRRIDSARGSERDLRIASIGIHAGFVDGPDDSSDGTGGLLRAAQAAQPELRAALSSSISRHLGPEFRLLALEITPSQSILLLAAIGLAVKGVTAYGDVRDGLLAIREDAEQLVSFTLSRVMPVEVESTAWVTLDAVPADLVLEAGSSIDRRTGLAGWSDVAVLALIGLVIVALLAAVLAITFAKVL